MNESQVKELAQYATCRQVAEHLGVDYKTLYNWAYKRGIKFHQNHLPNAKLNLTQVKMIKHLLNTGYTTAEISANLFPHLPDTIIRDIKHNATWRGVEI